MNCLAYNVKLELLCNFVLFVTTSMVIIVIETN